MLEVDRQMKATLLRAIPILMVVAFLGVYYHYWSKSPAADPEAMRRMEHAREDAYREELDRDYKPLPRFSGSLTTAQKDGLLRILSQAGKYSVDIIPIDKASEGSSISPAASKASAQEFADLFWKAGWDARVFEGNPHPASRRLGEIAVVVNPDSTTQSPRRGGKAAQILLEALKQNGIAARYYSSNKVDPETFEMHISVDTGPR